MFNRNFCQWLGKMLVFSCQKKKVQEITDKLNKYPVSFVINLFLVFIISYKVYF